MKKLTRIILIITSITVILIAAQLCANAQTQRPPIRMINVVYDDSVSTIRENGEETDIWCQERYALELLGAMLGENDTMHIYCMSDFRQDSDAAARVSLSGKDSMSANVQKIHELLTKTDRVYFDAVKTAYDSLLSVSADEKWLIVLTSKPFGQEELDGFISEKRKEVGVVFFALNPGVEDFPADEANGLYFFKAGNSEDIPDKMLEICRPVFNRGMLKLGKNNLSFTLDVSSSELTVFAMGEDASVSSIKNQNGETVRSSSSANARYTEKATSDSRYSNVKTDRELFAAIARFDENLEPGKYSVEGSFTDDVLIFFTPDIELSVAFIDSEGEEITDLNLLEAGTYRLAIRLVDCVTENEIKDSALLGDVSFTASVRNNSLRRSVEPLSGDTFEIEEGNLTVEVFAHYLDYNSLHLKKSYSIFKNKTITYEVVSNPTYNISDNSIDNGTLATQVRLYIDSKDFTDEQWQNLELPTAEVKTQGNQGIGEFKIVKSHVKGLLYVYPVLTSGRTTSGEYRQLELVLTSSQKKDKELWSGKTVLNIPVNDTRSWLSKNFSTAAAVMLSVLGIVLLLGYIPPIKKYLPEKMSKRPKIDCRYKDESLGKKAFKGRFKISLLSTVCPYLAQRGKVVFCPQDAEKAPPIKLKANAEHTMTVRNTAELKSRDEITVKTDIDPENSKPEALGTENVITYITPTATYVCSFKKKAPKKDKTK